MDISNNYSSEHDKRLSRFIEQSFLKKEASISKGLLVDLNYSWKLLDNSIFSLSSYEDLSVFCGKEIPESMYVETYFSFGRIKKRIIPHKFCSYINDGASIVLNKMQEKCIFINKICNVFSKHTSCVTNANSYAARGGSGTFNMHWDTHDVYAIQLIGKKRWKIYPPTFHDPLVNQKSKGFTDRPKVPCMDVILEEGDVLYIPRGWWHDATPIDNQETFHIAVGIFKNTIVDYLNWVVLNKMCDHVSARDFVQGVDQNNLKKSIDIFSEISTSDDVYNEFFEEYVNKIRVKSKLQTGAFFSNEYTIKDLSFNGVFKSTVDDSYIINGVKLELADEHKHLIENQMQKNTDCSTSVDQDVARNLILHGFFS